MWQRDAKAHQQTQRKCRQAILGLFRISGMPDDSANPLSLLQQANPAPRRRPNRQGLSPTTQRLPSILDFTVTMPR